MQGPGIKWARKFQRPETSKLVGEGLQGCGIPTYYGVHNISFRQPIAGIRVLVEGLILPSAELFVAGNFP